MKNAIVCTLVLMVAAPACAAGDHDTDASTLAGSGGASGSSVGFGGGPGSGQCGCSADLHTVVGCNGAPTIECPPDQGCTPDGSCVPACQSAELNQSNIGCSYEVLAPPDVGVTDSCLVVFVANTWGSPVTIEVSYDGMTLDPSTFAYVPTGSGKGTTYAPLSGSLEPGNVALLALLNYQSPSCALGLKPAVSGVPLGTGSVRMSAFQVRTSAPVVAYDIFPYGGGSSAVTGSTLLLPTSTWDTNYIADTFRSAPEASNYVGTPWIAFAAHENGTAVTISPTNDITAAPGVDGASKGTPVTYQLGAGETLRLFGSDLSGSVVQSTHPIGVWGGGLTYLPPSKFAGIDPELLADGAADAIHQQLPPIRALGSEYAAVRYRDRIDGLNEAPPWRLVGAVDGTSLSYDPPVAGAPTKLASGEVATFEASGPFVVKSQDADHPFYFGAHMTGCCWLPGGQKNGMGCQAYASPVGCAGDPEGVSVIPPAQYRSAYVFFTDPTYPETDLVLVRARGATGNFEDVTVDCAGTVTGWSKVDGAGQFEYARVDLVRGNFEKQGNCDNGRHEAKSKAPFGLTVWGWGSNATRATFFSEAVSYAYPGGASVAHINQVVVLPEPK